MFRLSRKFAGLAGAILVLLGAAAAAGGTVPYSDFEDGTLQGWTTLQPFHGDLLHRSSNGNPGGYMFCGDTMAGGGGLYARAPSDFTGDLSHYRGLQWDENLYNCDPDPTSPTYPCLYTVIGGDTTVYRESDRHVEVVGQWHRRFVAFEAVAWERVSGTASFDEVIHRVSMLLISMDTNTQCYDEAGVDNIMILGPDPDQSSADPWDAYGHAFVSPGTQSGVDALSIIVRDFSDAPLAGAPVEIRFFGCDQICIDYPVTGLSGTTDANGSVTLNPRVGGCDDCTIQVTADDIVLRTYTKVVSTDWNGYQANGLVDEVDMAWLVSAIQNNYPCGDYDGSGAAGAADSAMFMTAYGARDANLVPCFMYPPYGACCLPAGVCLMTTSADCLSFGVWHGEWYSCLPDPCPEPEGACCTPAGACTITSHDGCWPPNAWYGASPTCDPNQCPDPPVGACCATSRTCTMATQLNCSPPSVWHGAWLTCDPNPCPNLAAVSGPNVEPLGLISVLPNPARGTVEFRWLAGLQRREISVFDISGRLQWTCEIRGDQPIHWDGVDGTGRPVPQGVYVVRGRSGFVGVTQRFVVLR